MRRLHLGAEAEAELFDAALYYEQQREGLGLRFEREVHRIFEQILENPFQFPEIEQGRRRALLRPFPYGIFFTVDHELITVLAVFHLHRNPEIWRNR